MRPAKFLYRPGLHAGSPAEELTDFAEQMRRALGSTVGVGGIGDLQQETEGRIALCDPWGNLAATLSCEAIEPTVMLFGCARMSRVTGGCLAGSRTGNFEFQGEAGNAAFQKYAIRDALAPMDRHKIAGDAETIA